MEQVVHLLAMTQHKLAKHSNWHDLYPKCSHSIYDSFRVPYVIFGQDVSPVIGSLFLFFDLSWRPRLELAMCDDQSREKREKGEESPPISRLHSLLVNRIQRRGERDERMATDERELTILSLNDHRCFDLFSDLFTHNQKNQNVSWLYASQKHQVSPRWWKKARNTHTVSIPLLSTSSSLSFAQVLRKPSTETSAHARNFAKPPRPVSVRTVWTRWSSIISRSYSSPTTRRRSFERSTLFTLRRRFWC